MKIILATILASACFAQVGQVCVQPDKTSPAKQVCIDIPAPVRSALAQVVAAETTGNLNPAPRYKGVADLILTHVYGLLDSAVDRFPPTALQAAKDAKVVADALIETRRAAALARKPSEEDPK